MKQPQTITKVAGIDVGKGWLDVAIHGQAGAARFGNDKGGIARLAAHLREAGVGRVGLEASGGYERAVLAALRQQGFETVLHQPLEVRLFARIKRLKAKNDRLDASLIAAVTAQAEGIKAAADPRLVELAERLTAYEQVCDLAAQLKTFLEHVTLADLKRRLKTQIRSQEGLKATLAADIDRRIKAQPELARRMALLRSLPGVGPIVAASLIIRMPELGTLSRGQAAALLGVAPYDRDSGQMKGHRAIGGGRTRPRRLVYLAALAARRSSPAFKAFAQRLATNGKAPKVVLVALMRKLIEAANLVLARNQPWTLHPAQ